MISWKICHGCVLVDLYWTILVHFWVVRERKNFLKSNVCITGERNHKHTCTFPTTHNHGRKHMRVLPESLCTLHQQLLFRQYTSYAFLMEIVSLFYTDITNDQKASFSQPQQCALQWLEEQFLMHNAKSTFFI